MGTSNFYTREANRTYVVLESSTENRLHCNACDEDSYYPEGETPDTECPACKSADIEVEEITFAPDDRDVTYLTDHLRKVLTKTNTKGLTIREPYTESEDEAKVLLEIAKSRFFGEVEVAVTMKILLRYGYYEAANLDYSVYIEYDDQEDDTDDIEDYFIYSNHSVGLSKLLAKHAYNWAKKTEAELRELLEATYAKCSTAYNRIGPLSDGTSIYTKAV